MSGGGLFSDDGYTLFSAASPKVIDPESKPLVYYYDSQEDIDQRRNTHRDWLEKNKNKTRDLILLSHFGMRIFIQKLKMRPTKNV